MSDTKQSVPMAKEKSRWADELRNLIKDHPCHDRPFVCDGLPELCDVVVIGENPATEMNEDWWSFWDKKIGGFDLCEFEEAYEKARVARGKPPKSKTRLRLERLRSNELNCLETNAFMNERLRGAGAGVSNRPFLKTFINRHHLPRLKAVIVHGSKAHKHWRRLKLELPNGVQPYFTKHFRILSYDCLDKVIWKIGRNDSSTTK